MDPHLSHARRCRPVGRRGQLAFDAGTICGSKIPALSFVKETHHFARRQMAERPVATGTEARAGSKEGVVRYVLLASPVLVVVLFVVAYELFS
jgi:hypothetical protein